MPRRRVVAKREVLPDPKFGNKTLAKFMNHVMVDGKKSVAEKIVYGALDVVAKKPARIRWKPLKRPGKYCPLVEVKSRRVGGATYQVPVEVRPDRRNALAMRWLVDHSRSRGEKSMACALLARLSMLLKDVAVLSRSVKMFTVWLKPTSAFSTYRF